MPRHVLTSAPPREKCAEGGRKAAETIRRNKAIKAAAQMVLALIPQKPNEMIDAFKSLGILPEEAPHLTIEQISMIALGRKAMNGDQAAFEKLLELSGFENAKIELERERVAIERMRAENDSKNAAADLAKIDQLIKSIDDAAQR